MPKPNAIDVANEQVYQELQALAKDTPKETPVEATEAKSTPDPVVEDKTEVKDTPPPAKEETKEPDAFEKRYKDLQREFTKKTQELSTTAEENRQFREWYANYQAWAAQQGRQPQGPEPDSIPTVQQVQELVSDIVTKKEAEILKKAQGQVMAAQVEQYKRTYAEEVGRYVQELISKDELLQTLVDDDEDTSLHESMVKYAQSKLFGPNADPDQVRDIHTFKAHIKTFADKKSASLAKLKTNAENQGMTKAVKANKPGIAAPGGSTPAVAAPPKPPKFGTQAFRDYMVGAVVEEQSVLEASKKR